eukprot:scaffold25167_cov54-Phaeocystis_antarctica.AAC.4
MRCSDSRVLNSMLHITGVVPRLGASRVCLSALKPSRRVLDSTHLVHTATQHWIDRHAPYGPVPVPNSSPPRWAEWHLDRSRSSKERVEASPAR